MFGRAFGGFSDNTRRKRESSGIYSVGFFPYDDANKIESEAAPMKHARPANILTHRARRTERIDIMSELKKTIINTISLIEDTTILKMIYEIVTWIADHQEDLI